MRPVKNPIIDGHRVCHKCKRNLPVSEYYKNARAKYGLDGKCKECTQILKEKFLQDKPNYFKDYHQKHKEHRNGRTRFRLYGITNSEYKYILDLQGNRCAICWATNPNSKNWHVDHDHKTGKVRGILCGDCNRMLGGACDNFNTLKLAIRYLQKPETIDIERILS